eukprot:scaffold41929_cov33-Prasinocladus_malaysianus.AAC.1
MAWRGDETARVSPRQSSERQRGREAHLKLSNVAKTWPSGLGSCGNELELKTGAVAWSCIISAAKILVGVGKRWEDKPSQTGLSDSAARINREVRPSRVRV